MKNASPEVDQYIENAAAFAQPILERLRRAFHAAHPGVTEVLKWGVPHFEYKGVLAGMAAHKQHVNWGFWKASLIPGASAMGDRKVTDVDGLPSEKELIAQVKAAIQLNEEGIKVARPKRAPAKPPAIPSELTEALKTSPAARKVFDALPPSHQREYIEWITDAKQPATRTRRVATAIEWMSEGKPRNWKYMKK